MFPGACPRTASVGRGPQKAFLHRSYDTAAVPGKSRGCAGHITHPVCAFSQPRTHAAFFECAPAVSKTRTRRPGAGPFFQTGASPALQLVMQRPPAKLFAQFMPAPAVSKSRTVFVPFPSLARTRACGEQVAHPVCAFSRPRTPAVFSACGPAHGSCWPGPAGGRFACFLLYHRQLPKRKENAGNSKGVYKKERFSSFFALIRVVLLQVDIIFKY